MGVFGPPLANPPSALLEALDPIAVTGADFDVQLVGKSGVRPWTVKIANESPYAIRVDAGGYQDWIGPWVADVVPVGSATVMHVHPAVLQATLPTPPQSTLLVTLAPQGEGFPGTYPMALSRQNASYGQQAVIGTVSGAANTAPSKSFPVPAGTMSIGYLVRSDAGNATPRSVIIQGQQSFNEYVSETVQSNIGGPNWFPFAASDTSVLVTLDTNLGSPSAIDVLASPLIESVDVQQTFGSLAKAVLWNGSGSVAPITVDSPPNGSLLLGVSQADASPAPWQAAKNRPIEIRATMANNANLTLVAAVAGQIVYAHTHELVSDAAVAALEWQDTAGSPFGATRLAPAGDNQSGSFAGAPATALGKGVQLNNFSGAGINVWGYFTCSQQ